MTTPITTPITTPDGPSDGPAKGHSGQRANRSVRRRGNRPGHRPGNRPGRRRVGPRAILAALGAEFRGVFATLRRTSLVSWLGFGLILLVASAIGAAPLGRAAFVLQVVGFALVSLFLVWPEAVARVMREDDVFGVRERDSAAVVTYLPVAVATFALPFYLAAQATLFWRVMRHFPAVLDGSGWEGAWRLSLDNLLFTELFLDLFDVFGVGLSAEPPHLAGRMLVFVTRLVLSVGFVRVAVSILRAAYYRAHGLGRGADALAALENAVTGGDAVRAGHLGREIANDVRGTLDVLLERLHEAPAREAAFRCLRALRDWAIPTFQSRITHGDARAGELEALLEEMGVAWSGGEPAPPRRRPARIVALAAGLLGVGALLVLSSAPLAFGVGALVMVLLVWLLTSPRATYEAAMERGIAPHVSLDRLRGATLRISALLALAFLLVSWLTLWNAASLWPGSFEEVRAQVGRGSLLGFIGASLVRLQVFLSVPDVFRIAEPAIEQRPWIGSLLTLTLRTGLNLGFVAVVMTALGIRRDRQGFSGLLRVPDELGMRMEALRGGRYAHLFVTYHDLRVGQRLWAALDAADDADTQEALAASGAFDWCLPYDSLEEPMSPQRLRSQSVVIEAMHRKGWTLRSWVRELDEALVSGNWPVDVRVQVAARRAVMAVREGQVREAMALFARSYEWLLDGREALEPAARTEACAVWARSVTRAIAILPPDAVAEGNADPLAARASEMLAELVPEAPERFVVDALRLGGLRAVLLGRSEGAAAGIAELERVSDATLDLPQHHPWREVLLIQLLSATSAVAGMNAGGTAPAAGVAADAAASSALEQRLLDALGRAADDWSPHDLAVRAYDERLGEELGQLLVVLASLPASRSAFVTATRAAAVFEARYAVGVLEARGYAVSMRMFAAVTAHRLGAHEDVIAAAQDVFRLSDGMRTTPPDDHLLANTHAFTALAHRALGREEVAFEHAATAREIYARIAVSDWEDAPGAVAEGRVYLEGFGGIEA